VGGEPELLPILQAAVRLGLTRRQAYDWAARGILPGIVRVGRAIYVRRRALERWLSGQDRAVGSGEGDGPAAQVGAGLDGGAP
jgi:excisionase family DNA binding protein